MNYGKHPTQELASRTMKAIRAEADRAGVTPELVMALCVGDPEYAAIIAAKRDAV